MTEKLKTNHPAYKDFPADAQLSEVQRAEIRNWPVNETPDKEKPAPKEKSGR